jgi:hypothetical protein
MSADADPRRYLSAPAEHAFDQVRSVEQCHFKAAREVRRTVFEYYRRVQNKHTSIRKRNAHSYVRITYVLLCNYERKPVTQNMLLQQNSFVRLK